MEIPTNPIEPRSPAWWEKAQEFATELEALYRKHGFQLVSPEYIAICSLTVPDWRHLKVNTGALDDFEWVGEDPNPPPERKRDDCSDIPF